MIILCNPEYYDNPSLSTFGDIPTPCTLNWEKNQNDSKYYVKINK